MTMLLPHERQCHACHSQLMNVSVHFDVLPVKKSVQERVLRNNNIQRSGGRFTPSIIECTTHTSAQEVVAHILAKAA